MRSDLKIGIFVGVLLVLGLILYFVSRPGETGEPEATPTTKNDIAGVEGQETTPPVEQEVTPPVEQEVTPPVEQEVTPPVEQKVDPPVEDKEEVPQPRYYVVKEGDSLSRIAESYYGDEKFFVVIQVANKQLIKDPDKLQLGWRLRIPYSDEADEIWKSIK